MKRGASSADTALKPVLLVCGDDDLAVKQHAQAAFKRWVSNADGPDQEIIDAAAGNASEALAAVARLREAIQTLPLFGSGKVIWFKNCTFLGDDRTASGKAVSEAMAELARDLKTFVWQDVRLIITAAQVDKRKTFYKVIESIGTVELHAGWSMEDKNWAGQAETVILRQTRELGKQITDDALARLIEAVGPDPRQMNSEVEKLSLFVGARAEIRAEDVDLIVARNKHGRAFALADALGARDLPRLLRTLDEELWEIRRDRQRSEIGLLYGLIVKVRAMLFMKEMAREGWIKPDYDYSRFKAAMEKVPSEGLPADKRFNPFSMHPFVLHQALRQSKNYTAPELVRAMDLLLEYNSKLFLSSLDEALLLQQLVTKIVG